jgi:hypothetical protein
MAGVLQERLPALLETAEETANAQLHSRVQAAVAQAEAVLGGEQRRLGELRSLGNVPAAELASHSEKVKETMRCLSGARVSLDAVRVLLLDPRMAINPPK